MSTKECVLYGFLAILLLIAILIICNYSVRNSEIEKEARRQQDVEKAQIVQEGKTARSKEFIKLAPWNKEKK